jgi:hypothetical protein
MPRQIGVGMKPRNSHKSSAITNDEVAPVSTPGVQEEAVSEPLAERPDVEVTAPKQEEESSPKLDEPIVADRSEDAEALSDILRQSEEAVSDSLQSGEGTVRFRNNTDAIVNEDALGKTREFDMLNPISEIGPLHIDDAAIPGMQIRYRDESATKPVIGLRLNGDFGAVVTIPETLVQGCKDFAEADGGKSLDQWCTEFFVQALEAYCQPVKGR